MPLQTEAPPLWTLAGRRPDDVAVEAGPVRRTWAELDRRTIQVARGLSALGAAPGDHVALVAGNRVEFLDTLFGAWRGGFVHSPLKTGWTAREIGQVLDDAHSRVVVTDRPAARSAAAERGIPVLDLDAPATEPWLAGLPAGPLPADLGGYRMAFTSGTSGRPKGVTRPGAGGTPFSAAFPALARWAEVARLPGEGVHLFVSQLFHGAPLNFALGAFAAGATLRVLPRWRPDEALAALQAPDVTSTCMVPTMFRGLLALPAPPGRPPTLRTIFHGGEPCPVALKLAMLERFGDVLVEYYGFTEGGFTVAYPEDWRARPGTVGRPLAGMAVQVLDADGRPVPAGTTGTVAFARRDGTRMFGYLDDPARTEAAYLPAGGGVPPATFGVGDIGRLDSDGYLYLSGRVADVVVSAGVNVYPAEVEDALAGVPGVADLAAAGVPDAERGEVVALAVVLAPRADLAAVECALAERAQAALAPYKRPVRVVTTDALPRDPGTGKLVRSALRASLATADSPTSR